MEQRLYDAAAKLPATDAKLDTSQMTGKIRGTNSIRRVVITLAACAAAMCIILSGALSLASSVKEYNDAVAYFSMHNLSTDGLSRKEIKAVYEDIATRSFTNPKTAGVLASIDKIYSDTSEMDPYVKEMYERYFDIKRTHMPEDYEIPMITSGMHITEVIALLGKPHDFGPTFDGAYLEWETSLGWRFMFRLTLEKGTEDMNIFERYTQHSYIDGKPTLIDPIPTVAKRRQQEDGNYFDLTRTHRPAEEDILSITNKMRFEEVKEVIGKAHGIYGGAHGGLICLWQSAEGPVYAIEFSPAADAPEGVHGMERLLGHGVVVMTAIPWPPSWYAQYMDPSDPAYPKDPADSLSPTDPDDPLTPTEYPTDPIDPTDYPDLTEPTEPEPADPKPTEPKPTEPQPTEPQPTEPEHTEPYPEPSFEDPVTLTWCIPDSNGMYSYPDLDRIIAAINEITQREINTTIRLEVIPVGDYTEAMSMKYISAEQWDICFSGMWNNYKDAVMQGAFVELPVDMLHAYAPDLMETLNPAALEALKIQGEVYALPVQRLHARQSGLLFDTQLAEELGFDWRSVNKLEDLEPYFDKLLANGYTECIFIEPWEMMNYLQSYFGFDYLHSYAIPAAVRVSDQNGTVINPYETEELKAFARLMYKWYNKGYFTDEILSGSSKSRPVTLYLITGSGEQWQFGFAGQMVSLGHAVMTTEQVRSATLAISCYCKNPERAVAFINLLTTNEELLNLVTYGQEGIDWNWVDEDDKVIQREEYAYPGNFAFLVGNDCLDYYLDSQLVGGNETIRKINADARTSAILGFQYDATKMAGHMANIQAAADGLIRSIMCGMAGDPDAAIAKLNAELYAAGLQQVLDDMQSQVDAWKASQ